MVRFLYWLLLLIVFGSAAASADLQFKPLGKDAKIEVVHSGFWLDVPPLFQPDYQRPRKFTSAQMDVLVRYVLIKMERKLHAPFRRTDPQHVLRLAEFFGLTSDPELDLYSVPMEEADIRYFTEVNVHRGMELFPSTARELVIRFYWESLARLAAAHYKLEVLSEKYPRQPERTRAIVSDIATTGMFDKMKGMTLEDARSQDKERYDFGRLLDYLKTKV